MKPQKLTAALAAAALSLVLPGDARAENTPAGDNLIATILEIVWDNNFKPYLLPLGGSDEEWWLYVLGVLIALICTAGVWTTGLYREYKKIEVDGEKVFDPRDKNPLIKFLFPLTQWILGIAGVYGLIRLFFVSFVTKGGGKAVARTLWSVLPRWAKVFVVLAIIGAVIGFLKAPIETSKSLVGKGADAAKSAGGGIWSRLKPVRTHPVFMLWGAFVFQGFINGQIENNWLNGGFTLLCAGMGVGWLVWKKKDDQRLEAILAPEPSPRSPHPAPNAANAAGGALPPPIKKAHHPSLAHFW